jgi:hypothetical protein
MLRATTATTPKFVLEELTDPVELAKARARRERFDRNAAWLQAHADEVYSQNRGKYICIAGEELFVADSSPEALALGRAAHPEDDGAFVHHIPLEKIPLILLHRQGSRSGFPA